MNRKIIALAVIAVCFTTPAATAQDYKPTSPATGLWCTGGGTFVIRNGAFKYFRRGVLKYQTTYRISGNRIIKSGKNYSFFKNAAGAKFYRRDGKNEMIPSATQVSLSRTWLKLLERCEDRRTGSNGPQWASMRRILALATVIIGSALNPETPVAEPAAKSAFTMTANGLLFASSITPQDLAKLLRERRDVLLFDTREKEEFEVSRIPGAMRLDPAAHNEVVVGRVRKRARGAILVHYCTSNARSARIAEWAAEDLKAIGAESVYVLDKGIIGWANAGLPLVNRNGRTEFVHPFDVSMKRHMKHSEFARVKLPTRH